MNRPIEPVDVIIALADPVQRAEANLARFVDEVGSDGQVILVDASGGPDRSIEGVRVIRRPRGRLAPELWSDGLLATDSPLVAFSTAQMIPRAGWLKSLLRRIEATGTSGVGGPIEPGRSLSTTDRAVALLRYSGYFPTRLDSLPIQPPGDNALYRRDRLNAVRSSWADGFWETEVHRALIDQNESLAMSEDAVVEFRGGLGLIPMIRQRWAHARRYGAGRSEDLGWVARMARVLAWPVVPPLLGRRIVTNLRVRGMPLSPWIRAVPSLAILASAWALGEAVGTAVGSRNGTIPESLLGSQPELLLTQITRRSR